ncbi:MAG: hypothetical protein ACI978_002228 [Oleispira sp.]|jgi:hypothetical protein
MFKDKIPASPINKLITAIRKHKKIRKVYEYKEGSGNKKRDSA